jgi:cardiolipin synthase
MVPNLISISRIVLIPLFIYFLFINKWLYALCVFFFASVTDILDGWSARRLGQESKLGRFLDPLADKFLVVSALIALIILDPYLKIFDSWMIVIIVGRDMLITIMRYLAMKRGTELLTSRFGKVKTAFQMLSIGIIIMIWWVRKEGIAVTDESLPYWIMLIATLLTALSGLRYVITNRHLLTKHKTASGIKK